MRKLIAGVILVMMLCAGAWADVVYTTDSGNIGLIKITSSTSADLYGTQYSGIASNAFLGSYSDGDNTRVILVNRTTDTTISGDTALIFDPARLASPIDSTQKVLAGVYNMRAMVGSNNGRGLFFASGSSIHEFRTEDFSPARSYTYKPKTSYDIIPQMTGVAVSNNSVYALAEREESNDILLIFDGQLREDVNNFRRLTLPYDTNALAWLSNSRFAVAHDYGVDLMSGNRFARLMSSDLPVKSLCRDEEDGFYFAEQIQTGETYTTNLKHYSSKGTTTTLYTDTTGSACSVIRDENNGIIAAMIGSHILVYKMENDLLILECYRSSLGGLPTNIAMSYVKGDDKSSNSGCNATSAGVLMLLSLIFLKRR